MRGPDRGRYCKQPFHQPTGVRQKTVSPPGRFSRESADCPPAPPHAWPRLVLLFASGTWGPPADLREDSVHVAFVRLSSVPNSNGRPAHFCNRGPPNPELIKPKCN